ncbi:MAG: DUF115 domain-containing protein [Vicinamibacteraceae bacterium]|nr:DUF115 domain-containing protein [Vicinamibacteraceae bacterium]
MNTVLRRNLDLLALPDEALAPAGSPEWRLANEGETRTLLVRGERGDWIGLHSARRPLEEAARWIERTIDTRLPPPCVAVIGCGHGFVVDVLERRCPETVVVVVEPFPAFARLFLERRDWSALAEQQRLFLLVGPRYVPSPAAARFLEQCTTPPPALVHPVFARVWPDTIDDAREQLERLRFAWTANAEARRRFAGPYLLNTLANLSAICAEADASALEGAFTGHPVFVAAAGPSLDANLVDLRRVRPAGVLVAVDTALGPLTRADLAPDIVVSVDPSTINARHLAIDPLDQRTFLVAEGSVEPAGLQRFEGRRFFFRVARHDPWPWLEGQGIDRGRLTAWGSVLVTAIDLALRLGADPLVLFGADLAFTGDLSHCRGVAHEEIWALHGHSRETIARQTIEISASAPVAAIDGGLVSTSAHLLEFRDWIVRNLPADRAIINATGAGLLSGGPVVQAHASALRVGAIPLDVTATLRRRHRASRDLRRTVPAAGVTERVAWVRNIPGVTDEDVHRCLTAADARHRPTAHGGIPRHDPAVTAALHALLHRRLPPTWARERLLADSVPGGSHEACLDEARRAVTELLALPTLAIAWRPGALELAQMFGPTVPVSVFAEVSAEHTSTLTVFERHIAHIAARVAVPPPLFVWPEWTSRRTLGPDVAARAQDLPWARTFVVPDFMNDVDRWARWLLLLACSRAEGLIICERDRGASYLLADTLCTIFPAAMAPPFSEGPHGRVSLSPAFDPRRRPGALTVGIAPWLTSRAITGTVALAESDDAHTQAADAPAPTLRVEWPARDVADPRAPFYRGRRWRVEALDLIARGLPPCTHLTTLDADRVLATPYGARRSWTVDAEGLMMPDDVEWPIAVTGVLVNGEERTAWGFDDGNRGAVTTWRGDVCGRTWRLPTRVTRGVRVGPATIVFGSLTGDVLLCRTDTGRVECLGRSMPGIAGLTADGRLTIAEIRVGSDDLTERELPGRSWVKRDDGWTVISNGPLGPCWHSTSAHGWTFRAHPHADAVAIDGHGLAASLLAVYYPASVSWAGHALFVGTADGEILLFPDFSAQLERLRPASSPR